LLESGEGEVGGELAAAEPDGRAVDVGAGGAERDGVTGDLVGVEGVHPGSDEDAVVAEPVGELVPRVGGGGEGPGDSLSLFMIATTTDWGKTTAG
jgi:hypothetical protein